MEWTQVWRTMFTGWDGDVDLTALARELARKADGQSGGQSNGTNHADEGEAGAWVCQQIQEAY